MKSTGREKKNSFRDFSQSVLLDIQYLSCKYFPHSSTIASNRKYCRTFIEYTYSGAKSDVPASPENSHHQSSFRFRSLPFSLLYLSYLIFPLFALSRSIVFPLSLRPFCVFVSSPLRLPPPRGRGEPFLKASSIFLFLTRAETRTIIWPVPTFSLSRFFRSGATPRDNVSRKIPRGKYLARSLARSRCFTFH